MIRKLLIHSWKNYWRSPERGENFFSFIAMSLVFLIFAFYAATAGYYLPEILHKLLPDKNPVDLFNYGLIYLFAVSFLFRIFFQGFPTQAVEYYRALPVKRGTLITILLIKTLGNPLNILFIFFVVPFAVRAVIPVNPVINSLTWLAAVTAFELCNALFTFFIKKKIFSKPSLLLPLIVLLAAALIMEFISSASTARLFSNFFGLFLHSPVFVLLPLLLLLYLYLTVYRWLDKNFYPEDLRIERKEKVKSYSRYSYLENFGEVGSYMALELKMIFRNKRPRALFFYSLLFFLYPLFLYRQYFDSKRVYPVPSTAEVSADSLKSSRGPDDCLVTFKVESGQIPEEAYVYIYGTDKNFGSEKYGSVNLFKNNKGNWERTFHFERGRVVYYNFSLGSSKTVALDSSGHPLPNTFLNISADTAVSVKIAGWKVPQEGGGSYLMIVLWTIFMISYTALMYGQYLFAWEGGYFDFILSHKINIGRYIEAKFYVMSAASFLAFAILMVYIFMGIELLWLNLAALFYSIGVNSVITLFMGTFNRKRMDLTAGMMSQQGRDGFKQFLRGLPMIILMLVIYFAVTLSGLQNYVPWVYGITGIAALIFHKQLIGLAIKNFEAQRYKMAVGFRER